MRVIDTEIQGILIIEPQVFEDGRGYFYESFNKAEFNKCLNDRGLEMFDPVQVNESSSKYGVVRGLHFQREPHSQAKLVRVVKGEVYDVAVDLRLDSPTYGKYVGVVLSEDNKRQFYLPKGFAHGFVVLSETAVFNYLTGDYYCKEAEDGIAWDDPDIAIEWPIPKEDAVLSEKDRVLPKLRDKKEF